MITVAGDGINAQSEGGSVDNHSHYGLGGNGGAGGNVIVTAGAITSGRTGIYARSEGGYGGSSDYSHAGHGGAGGSVTVTANGDIKSSGGNGAIYAVSEGGEGGHSHGYDSEKGGNGGAGGAVSVTLDATGSINSATTGIIARSLGGDGDNGGDYGPAGNGGDAGSVTINSDGDIKSGGNMGNLRRGRPVGISGYGILRSRTVPCGAAGTITITSKGTIETTDNNSSGISADTYGASGGDITITSSGDITTAGTSSSGISAFAYQGNITISQTAKSITTVGNNASAIVGEFEVWQHHGNQRRHAIDQGQLRPRHLGIQL